MDLTQLKYFMTVAETENMSAAAKLLYMTQPAVSRSISRLEEELGIKLFERTGNRIILNDKGSLLYQYLQRAGTELKNGIDAVTNHLEPDRGSVVVSTSTHGILADACAGFLCSNPNAHLSQYILNPERMTEMLCQHRLDCCICMSNLVSAEIEWTPVLEDELLIYINKKHPLARERAVKFADLAGERFLLHDYGLETTKLFFALCSKAGFTPDLLYAGNEMEVPHMLLQRNLGIFVLPASMHFFHTSSIMPEEESDVKVLRISGTAAAFQQGIAVLRNRSLSPTARNFVQYLKAFFLQRNRLLRTYLEEG